MQQLALPLPHAEQRDRDSFLVSRANEAALAWVDRWPDWPAAALAIHGPTACGKSHLGQLWRERAAAVPLDAADPAGNSGSGWPEPGQAYLLDLGAAGLSRSAEEPLLHLYNTVQQVGGTVLICAREAPARWPTHLPDLRSRLAAVPAAAIGTPDDELLAAVLLKHFAERQLAVGADVIAYLVSRMERSFEAARRMVATLDHDSLVRRREITVQLARDVLAAGEASDTKL